MAGDGARTRFAGCAHADVYVPAEWRGHAVPDVLLSGHHARIEAWRRLGPQLWWNEATTEPGRDAIGFYHERKDETRNIGLGPEHDWSSHAADALGLMAICYQEPGRAGNFNRAIRYREQGWV